MKPGIYKDKDGFWHFLVAGEDFRLVRGVPNNMNKLEPLPSLDGCYTVWFRVWSDDKEALVPGEIRHGMSAASTAWKSQWFSDGKRPALLDYGHIFDAPPKPWISARPRRSPCQCGEGTNDWLYWARRKILGRAMGSGRGHEDH